MSAPDSKREFAVEIVRRLKAAGFEAYWAGGCVRDFLLGRPAKDYDIATSAHPEQVRDLFGQRRTLAVGASFGVILVRGPRDAGQVEVATFRSEGPYGDGRRPDHVAFTSAEYDAQRRDFTINGMFYDPIDLRVLDFVGGERDLAAGIVRAIGDPRQRMREDKLRLLRAVRFASALEFQLEERTAESVREMAGEILVVSAERIADELRRMLVDRHRARAARLAAELGLLAVIVPELLSTGQSPPDPGGAELWERTLRMLNLLQEPGFELAAAALLHSLGAIVSGSSVAVAIKAEPLDLSAVEAVERSRAGAAVATAICRRLRLSNRETDEISWLIEHQHALDRAPDLPASKLKRLMAHPHVGDLLALARARTLAAGGDPAAIVFCEEYLRNTPPEEIDPPALITGDDLIARGLPRGPMFRYLIEAVRDAQLDGRVHTREEALALAEKLAAERESG